VEKTIRLIGIISLLTLIPHLTLIPVLAQTVSSVPVSAPIVLDGVETANEWDNAAKIPLENGNIFVKNDDSKLYLLIDVVGDTSDDRFFSPVVDWARDYVNLVFDVNADELVTPNIDVSYQTYNEENIPLSIAYFTAPGSISAYSRTDSQVIGAFGSSTNSDQQHRIWEFAIDRQEINEPDKPVRMGLLVNSYASTLDIRPPNYKNDFTNLIEIALVNGGNVGGAATPAPTTKNQTATPAPAAENQTATPAPTTVSETWWTRPEIFVPITVAIIGGVVGPLLVARYGKRHRSKDETE
jgi:hypothetical protein